jgi:hypothetical protein
MMAIATTGGFSNLCTPAFLYLSISIIALVVMYLQNWGNNNVYCLGSYDCYVSNTKFIFIIKLIYIVFWTWILNLICNAGFTQFAWFLFLLPFILLFIFISYLFIPNY